MFEQSLSETELLKVVSFEKYLSQKRNASEIFETKYDFGLCRICQDHATGIHYGVCTCESCKAFFKRSSSRFSSYRCRAARQCVIGPKQRKKCKFCRWMTCVQVGMSFSKIRMGRIPNTYKEKRLKNTAKNGADKFFFSLKNLARESKIDRSYRLEPEQIVANTHFAKDYLLNLGEHHLVILSQLRDKSYQLYRDLVQEFVPQEKRALNLVESGYSPNFNQSAEFIDKLKTQDLVLLKKHACSMLSAMNGLPGFEKISKEDCKTILSNAFFTTLGIRTIKLFVENDYFLMLDEDIQLNRDLFAVLMGQRVKDKVFEFFFALKSLDLTDQEYALLIPFTLTLNEENLEEPKILRELGEYYLRALFYELSLSNRDKKFVQKLAKEIIFCLLFS
ncbi:Ecdysone-induced 78C [Brachionus plicatilis]|uniref:Ecdysone-induced 78C n=1 Tax=Brachionus plicatilis TaxID=10195 RepID=A0A3M7R0F3_BRAPC|nr:Ecdysone-induced 78C [Brachionus plicatilis]